MGSPADSWPASPDDGAESAVRVEAVPRWLGVSLSTARRLVGKGLVAVDPPDGQRGTFVGTHELRKMRAELLAQLGAVDSNVARRALADGRPCETDRPVADAEVLAMRITIRNLRETIRVLAASEASKTDLLAHMAVPDTIES